MVDVVNYVTDSEIIREPDNRYSTPVGTAVAGRYGFSSDLFRNLAPFLQQGSVPAATQEQMDAQSVEGSLSVRRAIDNVINISRPYDGTVIDELALRYNVPPGQMTDSLHRAAELLPGEADRRYEMVEILAERYGREARQMARVGPGANVLANFLDPVSMATYLAAGAGVATTTARATAAMQAGRRVSAVQQFAATQPGLFGAGVESAFDVGLQGAAMAVDNQGQREFSLANVALAAAVGGGFNKVLNKGYVPPQSVTPEQKAFVDTADIVQATTEGVRKKQAVEIVDGELRGGPRVGKVSGSDNKVLTQMRRVFAPLVKIYTSDVPIIRQTAEALGGVQTTIGGRVQDNGDIELHKLRLMQVESQALAPYIHETQNAMRMVGLRDDMIPQYVMTGYNRRRTNGISPDEIDMDELLRGLVDSAGYPRVQQALESLYQNSHAPQMRKLGGNLKEANVRGSQLIDDAEGKYLHRGYSPIYFPLIADTLGIENVGRLMFGGAILNAQGDDLVQAIAAKVASGQMRVPWYSLTKSKKAADKARTKKGTVAEKDTVTDTLTPDEILATFPTQLREEARKFSESLGKGMARSINTRLTQTFYGELDAAHLNDMADEFIEQLLKNPTNAGIDVDDLEAFTDVLKQFMYRNRGSKSESSMGPLNRRIKLDELHRVRWAELIDPSTQKPYTADALRTVQETYAKSLGNARMSRNDYVSFEDLLQNNYTGLMEGYFNQYASQMSLAARGINQIGGASVDDLVGEGKAALRKLEGTGISANKRKRAKRDLDAFIYLLYSADGRGIDYAKAQMLDFPDGVMRASLQQHTAAGKAVGLFRNISTSVHLGLVAFAQGSEVAQLTGTVGVQLHDLDRSLRFLREVGKVKDGTAPSEFSRDLMRIGMMNEGSFTRYMGMDYGSTNMLQEGGDALTKAYNFSSQRREWMGWMNLIKPVTMMMRAVAIGRTYDKLYAGATGSRKTGRPFSNAELQTYLTLNEEDMPLVYEAIQKFAIVNKKTGGVETLRADLWHTLGPKHASLASRIDDATFRFAHTIVQQSGRGYAPIFMQGGLGSTLFQFMSYASNSFEKQAVPTLLLMERGDPGAAMSRISGAVLGSYLGYAGRVYVRSLGMSEEKRKEYLGDNLTWDKSVIGTVAYLPQLSGPMIAGSIGAAMLGGAMSGDTNAIRRGFPTVPAASSAEGMLSTLSLVGRMARPEKDVTEAQLTNFLNYASLGGFNTPFTVVPRNVIAGTLGQNRNTSLSIVPPSPNLKETQQDQ